MTVGENDYEKSKMGSEGQEEAQEKVRNENPGALCQKRSRSCNSQAGQAQKAQKGEVT